MTVGADGTLHDRRRVELVDANLPAIPHHREARHLPPADALALVERVRASAERHAARVLDELARDARVCVRCIALRRCPPLPATVAECIADYRAQNVADWVMYRTALANAARARGWNVRWVDARSVYAEAGRSLGVGDFDAYFSGLRASVGAPWNSDHKLALAGAIVARETATRALPVS